MRLKRTIAMGHTISITLVGIGGIVVNIAAFHLYHSYSTLPFSTKATGGEKRVNMLNSKCREFSCENITNYSFFDIPPQPFKNVKLNLVLMSHIKQTVGQIWPLGHS